MVDIYNSGNREDKPPLSNRGAQNTKRSSLFLCVDWVQVTFFSVEGVERLISIFGFDFSQFKEVDHGLYGYRKQMINGNIRFFFDGNPGMGIHLQMSGQGCREFEQMELLDWFSFINLCFELGAKFTRFDLACDDIAEKGEEPYFRLTQVINNIRCGYTTSRFRRAKLIEDVEIDTGEGKGITVYFGKESSRLRIIFYEKYNEQMNKGFLVRDLISSWNRVEIRARDERANLLAYSLLREKDLGEVFRGVLANYIMFRRKSKDKNKNRWPVIEWWSDYLNDAKKLKLTLRHPERTVQRIDNHIEKQYAPSLAILFYCFGIDRIIEIINDGLDRLSDRDLAIIRNYENMKDYERDLLIADLRKRLGIRASIKKERVTDTQR